MHDVVIAGAGPVGLLLACELQLKGVHVLVLEKAPDPHSPLKALPFGMRGLTAPSIRALHSHGLLDAVALALRKEGAPGGTVAGAHWAGQPRKPGGHFAGIQFFLDRVYETAWPQPPDGAPDRH